MGPSYIEHIGIAVKNLNESIPLFENLFGISCYAIEEVPNQKVKTAFFMIGQTKIELLESTSPDSPIQSFVEKNGSGIHHIALFVNNSNTALTEAKEKGFKLIDKNSRKGADNLDIGFLHPRSTLGVLFEFCSK